MYVQIHMYVICVHVPNTGIAIIQCQGHKYSMEERDTTVINLEAHPSQAALYKAKNDPKVAALLNFLGVKKEEQYRNGDNKKPNKPVTYTMTATDAEKPKYLVKKLAELLPGFFDDDDKELICSVLDEKLTGVGQQKRQTNECQNQNEILPAGPGLEPEESTITIVTCVVVITEDYIYIFKRIDVIETCQ